MQRIQGQDVNSNTLPTISRPVGIWETKSSTLATFRAMCAVLAVSLPFCIAGTSAAAAAHRTVMTAQYKTNKTHSTVQVITLPGVTQQPLPRNPDHRTLEQRATEKRTLQLKTELYRTEHTEKGKPAVQGSTVQNIVSSCERHGVSSSLLPLQH